MADLNSSPTKFYLPVYPGNSHPRHRALHSHLSRDSSRPFPTSGFLFLLLVVVPGSDCVSWLCDLAEEKLEQNTHCSRSPAKFIRGEGEDALKGGWGGHVKEEMEDVPLPATYHPQLSGLLSLLSIGSEAPRNAITQHCYFVSDFVSRLELQPQTHPVCGISWFRRKWPRMHCAGLRALVLPIPSLPAQSAAATLAPCVPQTYQAQLGFKTFALGVAFAWTILPANI